MSFRSIRLPSHTMRPRATVGRLCLIAVLAVSCALSVSAPAANGAFAQPNRVTVIGDSVLTAVEWNAQPLSILEHGLPDVDLQIAVCRRLTGMSCPFEGERPPNLIDAVHALGNQIGATVVVEVGYNDPEQGFGDAVNTSIQTLLAAGVQRILWLNYHDWVPQYAEMNTILAQVAEQYPQVTIVDWQADSFIRYSWFQGDGIHLVQPGAVAIATLIHNAIVTALAPPPHLRHHHRSLSQCPRRRSSGSGAGSPNSSGSAVARVLIDGASPADGSSADCISSRMAF